MVSGSACGDRARGAGRALRLGIGAFVDDEGGYTSVAVAVALLVSLSLVFATATAEWALARSYEVQQVADAAAMAGANAVAGYSTLAQVADACVLSMGVTGLVAYGAGLVLSCVPGAQAAGTEVVEAASGVLDARRSFASSAARGLRALESALPALVVANSARCVAANARDGLAYQGCAVPYPLESQSDFSSLEAEVPDDGLSEAASRMAEASSRAEGAKSRADAALEEAWRADCVADPYCLRERASRLAGLPADANPSYGQDAWTFAVPLLRARAYYAARLAHEAPAGPGAEEVTRSAARRAFYAYALGEVRSGHVRELPDGTVDLDLPRLPHNSDETRETELYTQSAWPCTDEGGTTVLHASLACPGALGTPAGHASLSDLEGGSVARCDACGMDLAAMGSVAAASTSTSNGFEHYWRTIVQASEEYEGARAALAEAEGEQRELAEDAASAFSRVMDELSVVRPSLCPPGAWGCVAVVHRSAGTVAPAELTRAFGSSVELGAGVAVSAAVLAPDPSTERNNVLASFVDGLPASDSLVVSAVGSVGELWGRLLVGYGSAYGDVASAVGDVLDGVDGVFGGTVGSWLRERLKGVVSDAGLEPVDMRLRKPVLTGTGNVFDKAGVDGHDVLRRLVRALPSEGTAEDYARALGVWGLGELHGLGEVTVAEIEVPGTGRTIPLTIDLSRVGEAA